MEFEKIETRKGAINYVIQGYIFRIYRKVGDVEYLRCNKSGCYKSTKKINDVIEVFDNIHNHQISEKQISVNKFNSLLRTNSKNSSESSREIYYNTRSEFLKDGEDQLLGVDTYESKR